MEEMIRRSLAVKGRIVQEDPREKGIRAYLNLGHTFGHALESATGFSGWTHGEAVAWGIGRALSAGIRFGMTDPSFARRVRALLRAYGYRMHAEAGYDALKAAFGMDKKRAAGTARLVIPCGVGDIRLHDATSRGPGRGAGRGGRRSGICMKIDKSTFEQQVRFFTQGAVIFKENDEGAEMFIIIQGLVEIRKSTGSSSSKILTTLQKGDMFGEMAIIEKQPRSATAVAIQPTRVLVLNEKLYDSMLLSNPDFARKMNKVLSERIRRADAIIQNIMSTNRQNQLWSGLVQYANEKGVQTFKGSRVNIREFTVWAVQHLGMTGKDVQGILAQFLKREVIAYSARGKGEIIIEPKEGVVLPSG